MKLDLLVDPPRNGRDYKPDDEVRGRVQLQMPVGQEVPEVKVTFQGTIRLSVICRASLDIATPLPDAGRRVMRRTYFDDTKTTPPLPFSPTTNTSSTRLLLLPLPYQHLLPYPVFRHTQQDRLLSAAADDAFTLECHLRPRGLSSRRRGPSSGGTVVAAVPASPCPTLPSLFSPVTSQLSMAAQDIRAAQPPREDFRDHHDSLQFVRSTAELLVKDLGINLLAGSNNSSNSDNSSNTTTTTNSTPSKPISPPAYSPPALSPDTAISLEVVLPYPPVLCPGKPVDLGIFVHTPESLLATTRNLHLRSLQATLLRETSARAGLDTANSIARSEIARWPLWAVHGTVPVRESQLDTNSGVWSTDAFLCPPEAVRPGFRTCCLSQVYRLQVRMGLSCASSSSSTSSSSKDKVHYLQTEVDVIISEPPPEYGLAALPSADEDDCQLEGRENEDI